MYNKSAMEKLSSLINEPDIRKHLMDLFNEYTSHISEEAKYVKCLDLFDMYLQAYEYEIINDIELTEFFSTVPNNLSASSDFHPKVKEWISELMKIREKKINILSKDSNLNTILKNFLNKKQ